MKVFFLLLSTVIAMPAFAGSRSEYSSNLIAPETVMQGGLRFAVDHMGLRIVSKKFTRYQETGDLFAVEQVGYVKLSDGRACKGVIELSRMETWTYGGFDCSKGGNAAKSLYYDLHLYISDSGFIRYSFR